MSIKPKIEFKIMLETTKSSHELLLWRNDKGRVGIQVRDANGDLMVSTQGEDAIEFLNMARTLAGSC